jgi:hypothetical protein
MTQRTRAWAILHVIVVAGFLATVASYYHPDVGLTAFLTIPASDPGSPYELAAVQNAPHFVEPTGGGYDGQFYARLALEPLLRNPAIDPTLDLAPYRARRILMSWTAYAIGLGRPAWVLDVFAIQNVIVWIVFAWLLLRWFPVGSSRSFALWCGCLLTHGMLSSVRYALLDAPSALLLAAAVVAAERARPWVAAIILGLAGLARETSLLGVTLFFRFLNRSPASWLRVSACGLVSAIPLLLWMDYLRSIYRSAAWASGGNLAMPLQGLIWKARASMSTLTTQGWQPATVSSLLVLVAFVTQAIYVIRLAALRRTDESAWLPIALAYGALGLLAHRVVWEGSPGAVARVVLPLAIGFNVLARRAPWPVLALGNLGVVAGIQSFVFRV